MNYPNNFLASIPKQFPPTAIFPSWREKIFYWSDHFYDQCRAWWADSVWLRLLFDSGKNGVYFVFWLWKACCGQLHWQESWIQAQNWHHILDLLSLLYSIQKSARRELKTAVNKELWMKWEISLLRDCKLRLKFLFFHKLNKRIMLLFK